MPYTRLLTCALTLLTALALTAPQVATAKEPPPQDTLDVKIGEGNPLPVADSPVQGPEDALVTIVVFSDFQCPYCARANTTLEEVHEAYPDDVRIVFKHFPLPFHKQAMAAHRAAIAAGKQGKFWEMHDLLFRRQRDFNRADMNELMGQCAAFLDLDVEQFHEDRLDKSARAQIKRDMALGKKQGVRGTPHFLINGARLNGAQPLSKFREVIDQKLKEAKALKARGLAGEQLYAEATRRSLKDAADKKVRATPTPKPKPLPTIDDAQLARLQEAAEGMPHLGAKPAKAEVVIYEFSDLQCPFCRRANKTIHDLVAQQDGVSVVFLNLPLPFHKQAEDAALAALAAHRQGKYMAYRDALFARQKELKDDPELLIDVANSIGLDLKKFERDMRDDALRKAVRAQIALAKELGIRGTPNFIVGTQRITGAQPLSNFERAVEQARKESK